MGKKGGLYDNWLKNFTLNVMTQTFHAFFLMFVMKMLSEINYIETSKATELHSSDGTLAVMSIVGMMSIIKFEKLFKRLFGMEDSLSGDLKGAGAKMFMGLHAASNLQREIKEPFKKTADSKRRMSALGKDLGLTKTGRQASGAAGTDKKGRPVMVNKIGSYIDPSAKPVLSDKANDYYEKMKEAKRDGNMDLYKDYRDRAAEQMRQERGKYSPSSTAGVQGPQYAQTAAPTGVQGPQYAQASYTGGPVAGQTGAPVKTREQRVREYNDSVLEHRQNRRKQWMDTAGTLTSLAVGLGATDELSEALKVADIINDPINRTSGRVIDDGERKVATQFTNENRHIERTLSHAIKEGFKDATRNSRNESGKINPIKLTVDVAKSYAATPIKTVRDVGRTAKVNDIDHI